MWRQDVTKEAHCRLRANAAGGYDVIPELTTYELATPSINTVISVAWDHVGHSESYIVVIAHGKTFSPQDGGTIKVFMPQLYLRYTGEFCSNGGVFGEHQYEQARTHGVAMAQKRQAELDKDMDDQLERQRKWKEEHPEGFTP